MSLRKQARPFASVPKSSIKTAPNAPPNLVVIKKKTVAKNSCCLQCPWWVSQYSLLSISFKNHDKSHCKACTIKMATGVTGQPICNLINHVVLTLGNKSCLYSFLLLNLIRESLASAMLVMSKSLVIYFIFSFVSGCIWISWSFIYMISWWRELPLLFCDLCLLKSVLILTGNELSHSST